MPDGRWVWATFHTFQWDLNYSNPEVFRAMAGEMLFLANQGVDILRMDAVAFIWKQLGTPCENLPEAHLLLRAFNAVCRLAAPSLLFKSEAIVHPDEVAQYIDPAECQLSYNPLQMALIWEAHGHPGRFPAGPGAGAAAQHPGGTSWVNYVRSHDDIGWTFADEDAAELGINGFDHRRFLNSFYVNRFPGSFARGVPVPGQPPDRRLPHFRHDGVTLRAGGRHRPGGGPHPAGPLGRVQHRRRPAALPRRRGGTAQRLRLRPRGRPRHRQPLGPPAALSRPPGTPGATTLPLRRARCSPGSGT